MALNEKTGRDSVPSSRDSLEGAGWRCQRPGSYKDLIPSETRGKRFSWLNPRTLWLSRRNEWIARFLRDPVDDERRLLPRPRSLRPYEQSMVGSEFMVAPVLQRRSKWLNRL